MYKFMLTAICLLGLLHMSAAQVRLRACPQIYCLDEEDTENSQSVVFPQSRRTHSRPGKRGPVGPPGTVNYTRIDESLRVKYEEFEAGIAEKMKEFQSQIKESLANNEELLNNRTNELREFDARTKEQMNSFQSQVKESLNEFLLNRSSQQAQDVEAKIEEKMTRFESMIGESLTRNEEKFSRCNAQLLELEERLQKYLKYEDCNDICRKINIGAIANQPIGFATRGSTAWVFPEGFPEGLEVYCDCSSGDEGEAWTVFQRRMDGSQDFYQNWQSYVNGFGSKTGEFWLGLDALSKLASNPNEFELRIDLMDWENETRFAEYSSFSIGDASTNYKLTLDGYSGDAGDSLIDNEIGGIHNLMAFSSHDDDNDQWKSENCARQWHGAWWFNRCFSSHLNGKYYGEDETSPRWQGIIWDDWKGGSYSLKATEMKMRKKN